MRVLHVVTDLQIGGAETALFRLVTQGYVHELEHRVVSLTGWGPIGDALRESGVSVQPHGTRRDTAWWSHLFEAYRPSLVHTWLIHANLLGSWVAGRRGVPTVWSIRHGRLRRGDASWRTRALIRLGGLASRRLAGAIVSCSWAAAREHVDLGYPEEKIRVIPNGFDLGGERLGPEARPWLRGELGLPADAVVIGMVARWDPMKDHPTFIEAAARVASRRPRVHFVLAGRQIDRANASLCRALAARGLTRRVHLLGERDDSQRVIAALDVLTLTSTSEGFPNVLGEAMAHGVPCVATDVGDCARILDNAGIVLPPRDPEAVAVAWQHLVDGGADFRSALGARGRARAERLFDIRGVALAYANVYRELAEAA